MKFHSTVCAALFGATLVAPPPLLAVGGERAVRVNPRTTAVLLLPPVDATVDAAKIAPLRQQVARLEMEYQFIARQFVVSGDGLAARAAALSPAIDLRATERAGPAALNELARRAQARWVVRIIVLEIASVSSSGAPFQAGSTIRLQIWDAQAGRWLADEIRHGQASEGGPPGWLFVECLRNAVENGLADVLGDYPLIVKVSRNGSIVDYLRGQTAPLVAEAGRTFAGLHTTSGNVP